MYFDSNSKLLVVAAHPDDEVLGCGGTIAKAVDAGAKVKVMFCGEGIAARFPIDQYDSEQFRKETDIRMQGAKKSLATLGVHEVQYSERYCGLFDREPLLKITKEICQVLAAFQPTVLFTHDNAEVNTDHRIVYRAVEAACRPTGIPYLKEIYTFEVACSGRWVFDQSFHPNVFVDVKEQWLKKMAAWHCYAGEDRPFPFPRSDQGLETLARYRGMMCGREMAEAFRLMRKIS